MTRVSRLAVSALACAALLAATGCSNAAGSGQQYWTDGTIKAESKRLAELGHESQAEALADGRVTGDEYEKSYNGLKECIEEGGYAVSEALLSPLTNTTYEFTYNSNGLNEETALTKYDDCEARHWLPLSTIYRDTAPQHVDAVLLEAIVTCMADAGEPVEDTVKTVRDLAGDGGARRDAALECADSETSRLYPELPSVTVAG